MYCRCSDYIAMPQIYSHGVHCLSIVPFIPVIMVILGLITTYMNLLSTWSALKSNFICVMSNPTPPKTKKETKFTRYLLWQMLDIFMREFMCIMFMHVIVFSYV